MSVERLTNASFDNWDEYVHGHAHGSPFHLTAWKRCIEETFGYEPHYLVARSSVGRTEGLLPLFYVDGLVTGRVLISVPFGVYGGVLSSTPQARDALVAAMKHLAGQREVQYVELRNAFEEQRLGLTPVDRYVTFTQPVRAQSDEELLADLPKKTRNLVRKALRNEYSTRRTGSLDAFYELLCASYHRLGTPVFPRAFFERMQRYFGEMVEIREILLRDRVAAVALNFLYGRSMHNYYAASEPDLLPLAPNNYMYFDLLRWAGNHGCEVFDFGRSKKDTGPFEFKRHWATTMHELPYEVMLVQRKDPPNFSPKNPKFEAAIWIWRKLPLPVANWLGPRLIRLFP